MKESIKKVNGKWRLMSKDGKILGEYDTEDEAKRREKDIQYFKLKYKKEGELTLRDLSVIDQTDGSWDDEMGIIARQYLKRRKMGYDGEEDTDEFYNEALTAIQRIKRRAIMRKSKAAIARGKRRAARNFY